MRLVPGRVEAFYAHSSPDRNLLVGISGESTFLPRTADAARHHSSPFKQPAGDPLGAIPSHVFPASGGEYAAATHPGGDPVWTEQRGIRRGDRGRNSPWRRIDLAAGPERRACGCQRAGVLLLWLPGFAGSVQSQYSNSPAFSHLHRWLWREFARDSPALHRSFLGGAFAGPLLRDRCSLVQFKTQSQAQAHAGGKARALQQC